MLWKKNKYSCMLFFSKNENSDIGFSGWKPEFKRNYLILLKDFDYEKKEKIPSFDRKRRKI